MRLSDVEPLRQAVQEANAWVAELRRELGLDAPHRAYAVLRAVLHAVRDALPYERAMRFLTALPAAVRGAALEGWTSRAGHAPGEVTRERVLARIAEELMEVPELAPDRAARAVLETLTRRVPNAAALLPESLRESTAGTPVREPDAEERRAALEEAERDIRAALEEARGRGVPEEELPAIAAGRRRGRRESPSPAAAEHVDVLDRTLQKTFLWVKETARELGWENPPSLKLPPTGSLHAFRALAATLQALRERLLREEMFQLAAQLPILLRGFAFEGWTPGEPYTRERRKEDFLRRVADRLRDVPGADPEAVARAVFRVLSAHVAPGELADVRAHLPEPLRGLWPGLPAPSAAGGSPRSRSAAAPGTRARGRQARKEIRSALARAKARGVPERELPLLTSRRSLRRKRRRTGPATPEPVNPSPETPPPSDPKPAPTPPEPHPPELGR